jgi:hypothetical protein
MPIADSTKKAYDSLITRLRTLSGGANVSNTSKMIETVEAIRRPDGKPITMGTKKNYYVALYNDAISTPTVAAVYREKFMKINKSVTPPTPPAPDFIPWAELQVAGIAIMGGEDTLEHRILAGLVTQLPPLRLDYTGLRIFTKAAPPPADFAGNYVHLKSPKMSKLVVQEHKTASTYGALTRKLPPAIYALITQWVKENPGKALLDMTPNVLGRLITRIFMKHIGKPVTMNTLRHSYVSAARAGDRKLTEVQRIARELGHSIYTNEAYRRD